MRLPLRSRFALLAATLVVLVASLVGLAGYLSFRSSLLSRAASSARAEASRLASMVAIGENGNGQNVDLTDQSLTRQLATPGLLVSVVRANGKLVQSTPGRDPTALLSAAFRRQCLASGIAQAQRSTSSLALACARLGNPQRPLGAVAVGVPLQTSLAALASLRRTLILGVLGGGVLAAFLSLLVAGRALRPVKRIASAAETIRSGDLGRRIGYRGRDELGELASVLDACFAELQEAVERQRRFAADASHELRTPLAAIRANVELLQGWAGIDARRREAVLQSLDASSRRASRLVADLLHLVRSDREPSRPWSPVRLDEVVLAAVREATPLRREVPIRVAQLDDVTVRGDPLGLQQVLLNVLDNALQASRAGLDVELALTAADGRAQVTVSDQGPGLEPGELERIFDRFYSKKRVGAANGGAGLGLPIARSIARAHGGDLIARGEPGAGATFVLDLPAATPDGPLPADASGRDQAAARPTTARAVAR
jgi:signal transduction histidine kinase